MVKDEKLYIRLLDESGATVRAIRLEPRTVEHTPSRGTRKGELVLSKVDAGLFVWDGYKWVKVADTVQRNRRTLVLYEKSPDTDCHQGVTASEDYYYTVHTDRIDKRSKTDWSIVSQNTSPLSGLPSGINHLGDPCYYNGKLYIPAEYWEDCSTTENQVIAIYDAETLQLLEYHDISSYVDEASSIAIDPRDGILYVASFCSGKIYKFDLNTLEYLGEIDTYIRQIQGIAFREDRGALLVSSGDGILYEIDTSGNIIDILATADATYVHEGVAVDTDGGILWLQDDGTIQSVWKYYESTYYTSFEFNDLSDFIPAGADARWYVTTSKAVTGQYSLEADATVSGAAHKMLLLKKRITSNKFMVRAYVYCCNSGGVNNPGGLVIHAYPDKSGRSYVVELSGGSFFIRKAITTTSFEDLAVREGLGEWDGWFVFEVIYNDGTIKARVLNTNGTVFADWIEATDTEYKTGYVGVRTYRNQNWFDNFTVIELK